MAYFLYASFPNSRGRPRNPTVAAITKQVTLTGTAAPLTQIVGQDFNRTYCMIENLDSQYNVIYLYATTVAIDPSVTALSGVENELVYNVGTNTLYQKQDDGLSTNWNVVLPEDVGETIFPEQVANLDALGEIWALIDDAAATFDVGVDVGRA